MVNIGSIFLELDKIKESIVKSQKAYADKAGNFATLLFWISITLMILFGIVVVFSVLGTIANNIHVFNPQITFTNLNWNILLCCLLIAVLLLLPVIDMANESKKQRDKENKYRELEIKMAAIETYFTNISEQTKDNQNKNDNNVIIPNEVSNLIKNILEVVCKK